MNFEIKALDLSAAAAEECDLLVVLVPKDFKAGKDALSQLVGGALKSGDLETGVGKCLALYRPIQSAAVRVVLASAGEGKARQVKSALNAALGLGKSASLKRLVICFAGAAGPDALLEAAAQARTQA